MVRDRLGAVAREELAESRERLYSVLWHAPMFREKRRVFGFYPIRNEVDCLGFLKEWLKAGCEVYLPRVSRDREHLEVWRIPHLEAVEEGYYGLMEPRCDACTKVEPPVADVVLVPGLAFDSKGARLGQGRAYYDRLLAMIPEDVPRVGLAHSWQVLDGPESLAPGVSIPMEPHDLRMHWVATPRGLIECGAVKEHAHD